MLSKNLLNIHHSPRLDIQDAREFGYNDRDYYNTIISPIECSLPIDGTA